MSSSYSSSYSSRSGSPVRKRPLSLIPITSQSVSIAPIPQRNSVAVQQTEMAGTGTYPHSAESSREMSPWIVNRKLPASSITKNGQKLWGIGHREIGHRETRPGFLRRHAIPLLIGAGLLGTIAYNRWHYSQDVSNLPTFDPDSNQTVIEPHDFGKQNQLG